MKFVTILIISVLSVFSIRSFAQESRQHSGGSISGTVLDALTGKPVEYATVVVFTEKDKKQVTGSITRADGTFNIQEIRPGKYYTEISFIGYEKKTVPFEISSSVPERKLGKINIDQTAVSLKNVVVEGQRVPFTYQVDKKVINVDQFATSVSGTAAEVLENIPSISVDVEGNVSLRGSGSFKVLIDGRPSIIDAQDLLQQIPASSIDNIEIITNPSVKYDAEGIAGIINIILKKNENSGVSGVANISAGLRDKYGSDFVMEYKNSSVKINFGMDLRKRTMTNTSTESKRYDYMGGSTSISSSGSGSWQRGGYGTRGSIEFTLGSSDVLGIGARYHNHEMNNSSSANYSELLMNSTDPLLYINRSEGKRNNDGYALSTNYQHKFELKGHELTADVRYESEKGDDQSLSELLNGRMISDGKKTTEGGPGSEFETKVDYTLPTGEFSKFEAGLEGGSELANENSGYYEYMPASSSYIKNNSYSYSTKSRNDGYSVYSVYSGMLGELGYQAGIRGEFTYRKIEIPSIDRTFNINRWDFFPTFHFSYKIPSGQQFIASYAKRIHRPDGWALEPFDTWIDANTVHRGNPGLQPELIDSYEFGIQSMIANTVSLTAEIYHRANNSKIDGIRSVYSENVTLQTFANIGKDYSTGTEIMASTELFKLWGVDLTGNIYNYRLNTNYNGQAETQESFNWRAKLNNSLKLSSSFSFQLNAEYSGPTVAYQRKTKGSFSLDLAVKKDIMDKMFTITLQARNILDSAKWDTTTEGGGYYSNSFIRRESPMVMLNLRYTLNNFRQERNRDSGGGEEEYNGNEG
ncbi:MAG: TonB-dependent receptor domain-containing protein [Syntrophothermus sp.]